MAQDGDVVKIYTYLFHKQISLKESHLKLQHLSYQSFNHQGLAKDQSYNKRSSVSNQTYPGVQELSISTKSESHESDSSEDIWLQVVSKI